MKTETYELSKGYVIPRILNGCWQLSLGHSLNGPLDFDDVKKAFYLLKENGFNTFDCADIYTGAEEFIGSFIKELKDQGNYKENDVQIHTKYVPDLEYLDKVNMDFTRSIIERSLSRLNKSCLDVVQFHWWDYEIPGMVETAKDLQKLKEEGLIRNVSVTNFDTDHLRLLVDAGVKIASCQTQYSLFDRRTEKKLQSYCKENGIPLICYGTLAGGFLSEKYLDKEYDKITPETRSQVKYLQIIEDSLGWDGYQKLLYLLKEIAERHEVRIPHVATRYILQQDNVAAAVIGIRNSKHVLDNLKIFSFELSEDELKDIRNFIEAYPTPEGEPFELERTIGSKYRNIMHMNINEEEQS